MSAHQTREEAHRLAAALRSLRDEQPFVLAIARGGLIAADVVARALGAPLDVLVAGTVAAEGGGPIGALAEGGARVVDARRVAALGLVEAEVDRLFEVERARQAAMEERMRGTWPMPALAGRTVVLVDDSVVTGLTMRAAIAAVRARNAARIVVAAPLCAIEAAAALGDDADDIVYATSVPAAVASRLHDAPGRATCPPLGDAEIHDMIVRELRDVGADPFADLMVDDL